MAEQSFVTYSVIAHPTEACVLLLATAAGWELPRVRRTAPDFMHAQEIVQELRASLGLETAMLRCLHLVKDGSERDGQTLVAVETLSAGSPLPSGAAWVGRADFDTLTLVQSEYQGQVVTWLEEDATRECPAQRQPWALRGWQAEARKWIQTQARRSAIPLDGSFVQYKTWTISTVVRCPATGGDLYLKAVPPLFACEPTMTNALA